jgi:hypothetical protein
LNFTYVHLNRLIKLNDLDMIYIIGPGHGGPGLVAHTYLEGSYSEIYPNIDRRRNGMERRSANFPGHTAFRVMSRRKRQGRSTKAANSAIHWPTLMEPRSTIRT